jgi:hypothetical protein
MMRSAKKVIHISAGDVPPCKKEKRSLAASTENDDTL